MRKVLYAFGLCIFLVHSATSQVVWDINQYRFNGSVNSVRIEKSQISEKEGKAIEAARVLSSEYTFDSRGRLIASMICDSGGSPYVKYKATYNDSGKVEETYHKPKGDLIDKMVYSYGPDRRLIQKRVEKARDSPASKAVFSYDDKGRIVEKLSTNIKDGDGMKVVYSYYESQGKLEYVGYDLKGTQLSRTIQKYDKRGRLIEEEFFQSPGSGRVSRWSFVYDALGNIAEETLHLLDAIGGWRYEYQNDSHNNWTKRTTFAVANKGGTVISQPVEITYRAIAYNASVSNSVGDVADLAAVVGIMETNSFLLGEAVRRQQPSYPDDARLRRQAGKIIVHILVDESGRVISARAMPNKAETLRSAATFAALGWRFNPTVTGGIASRVIGPLTFNFHL
jgi:TonB family protein